MKKLTLWLIVASLACAIVPMSYGQQSTGEYRLGPKDLLEIKVFEIPELNLERRVSDNGTLVLPLLGEFSVSGMTASEVHDKLETMLTAKYVNRANVSIVIKEFANKPLSIVGAVERPGSLPVSGRYSLLQAISAAGGLSATAGKRIYVLRKAENGLTDSLEINTDDLFRGSSQMWNIPVFPSDVVNVPARSTVKVYCMGAVNKPGDLEFYSDDRISLLSVIAKAGGLTDRASKEIHIKHRNAEGKDVEMKADYRRIVSGKVPDPTLQPDDVVVVQESFF